MYRGLSVLTVVPVLNEERKIGEVVRRVPREVVDQVLVVDDGSSDGSTGVARAGGATVIELGATRGVGAALRTGYRHAIRSGVDVVVTIAGNNKDAPEEMPRLIDPIAEGRADFVQGSRFMKRDASFGAMPLYRRVATRLHPLLFSLAAGKRVTESTNGFRAIHTRILMDPRIDLSQARLDGYELEPYLYLRTIKLGYATTEVPVTKVYPPKHVGQTKMRPFTDWWAILRPIAWALSARGTRRERDRYKEEIDR